MATIENSALLRFKDKDGNNYLIYPINRVEDVDGLEEALAEKQPKLMGTEGQVVMIGADGNAVPTDLNDSVVILRSWTASDIA